MRKVLFILLFAVLLVACGQGEDPTKNSAEKPPELIVRSHSNEVVAVLGTYSWTTDHEDGSSTSIEADSFGLTEIVNRQSKPLQTTLGSEVDLYFASTPNEIIVEILDNDEVVRDIEVDGTTFKTDEKGTIIYKVYANWDEGSAYYAVKLRVK